MCHIKTIGGGYLPLSTRSKIIYNTMIKRKQYILTALLLWLMAIPTIAQHKSGNLALSIAHKTSDSIKTCNVNIGIFGAAQRMHGAQMNVFSSSAKEMRGVQMAGIANLTGQANGLQLAAMTNVCSTPMRGVQLAGVSNVARGVKRGVQMAGVVNVCAQTMRGVQAALYNHSDSLNGWQVGIINACSHHPKGVQVGIINMSGDTVAHKIGLVNINPKTVVDVMLYGGSSTKTNMAVRFRNKSTYSILGIGTHFMGMDNQFSGAVFYRLGQSFAINPRLSLSADIGYYHVETFEENSNTTPQRLYSLQGRVNIDYRLGRTLGCFASVGYGDTRYYHHSTRYRHRMIAEAGITLNINHHTK